MKENPKIELGIHPNFNFLVRGDFRYGKNIKEVLEYYLSIVPDAVSIRSHDLMQKSELLNILSEYGLKYDCNLYIPYNSKIINKPFIHWDHSTIRVPHFWEDDVACLYNDIWNVDNYLNYKGVKVFDFHPIHIALNSENMERYTQFKNHQQNSSVIFKNKFNGYGSECFLMDIIKSVSNG